MRALAALFVLSGLAACSSFGDVINRPSAPVIRGEPRPAAGPSTQISQCRSAGARDARIQYPAGWHRRVAAVEVEDELLGGGPSSGVASSSTPTPAGSLVPSYPKAALSPPTEGVCEVKFDLSRRGVASNAIAACSNPLFLAEAVRAVEATRFEPFRVNGQIATGINQIYPLMFCLAD
jgi:protein TonB